MGRISLTSFLLLLALVVTSSAENQTEGDCAQSAKETDHWPFLVALVLPIVLSAMQVGGSIFLVWFILKRELKRLEQVEKSAFQVMDSVLNVLIPRELSEAIGCSADAETKKRN